MNITPEKKTARKSSVKKAEGKIKKESAAIKVHVNLNSQKEETANKVLKVARAKKITEKTPEAFIDDVNGKKKILFVSSEAAPFITTGGLGEVIGALPSALTEKDENLDIRIIIPYYDEINNKFRDTLDFIGKIYVDLGWRHQYCGIYTTKVGNVTYYFVDNEYYFKRADCYGFFDDGERFAFFGKAVLEILKEIKFTPDIIHTHDWQSALVCIYLRTIYKNYEKFKNIKTIFTIHNIEYQGKYSLSILYDIFDLPYEYKNIVEFDGQINLMKGAIMCSDLFSTVSKNYANEIHNSYFAYGLDPIINMQTDKIRGILNGIDTNSYNPQTDTKIFKNYNTETRQEKLENKLQLQNKMNLMQDENTPIIAIITRLVRHKGIDLVVGAMNELVNLPVQFVLLGKGEREYELLFESFAERYPGKVSVIISYNNELSRKIYAGADMLLVPSKFEPCGITQMIASRYGTVPLVRETGGLKDSIIPYETGHGNGFTFYDYISGNITDIIKRALKIYNNKDEWDKLVETVMNWDFTWDHSAEEYLKMYSELYI